MLNTSVPRDPNKRNLLAALAVLQPYKSKTSFYWRWSYKSNTQEGQKPGFTGRLDLQGNDEGRSQHISSHDSADHLPPGLKRGALRTAHGTSAWIAGSTFDPGRARGPARPVRRTIHFCTLLFRFCLAWWEVFKLLQL